MKLRLSRLAPYGALMAVSLIRTFAFQASAQSSSEDPPHPMQQDSQPPSLFAGEFIDPRRKKAHRLHPVRPWEVLG